MTDNISVYLLKQFDEPLFVILDDLQNLVVKIVAVVRGVDDFLALLVKRFADLLGYSIIKWISLSLKLLKEFFFASRLLDSPSLGKTSFDVSLVVVSCVMNGRCGI